MFLRDLTEILCKRHYLIQEYPEAVNPEKVAYYNAYLLSNFGIIVDKPELLTKNQIKAIDDVFRLNVPNSYFANPQDTKYYTKDELFIEQILSYYLAYGEEDSHIRVFKKDLPEYPVGDDIKVRKFKIVNQEEIIKIVKELTNDYCAYKRPWNNDEIEEFMTLFRLGFYDEREIECADNIFLLLPYNYKLARFLYKKDIVKYSIKINQERSNLHISSEFRDMLIKILPLLKNSPMSKKQSKYFNTLIKKAGLQKSITPSSNYNSPYKKAKRIPTFKR